MHFWLSTLSAGLGVNISGILQLKNTLITLLSSISSPFKYVEKKSAGLSFRFNSQRGGQKVPCEKMKHGTLVLVGRSGHHSCISLIICHPIHSSPQLFHMQFTFHVSLPPPSQPLHSLCFDMELTTESYSRLNLRTVPQWKSLTIYLEENHNLKHRFLN